MVVHLLLDELLLREEELRGNFLGLLEELEEALGHILDL